MHKLELPSQSELKELFDYDPETGVFTWRKAVGRKIRAGAVAGTASNGYIRIRMGGAAYKAHRLAWVYVHGKEPADQIDHVNGDGRDNRIANLREASHSENAQNRHVLPFNKSGYAGVIWDGSRSKWVARIMTNRRYRTIGAYDDKAEAAHAYRNEKKKAHPFQTIFE